MDLKFVKFLDVESPLGISQNPKESENPYNSIGVDFYVPRPDKDFVDGILKANKKLYFVNNSSDGEYTNFTFLESAHKQVIKFSDGKFTIFSKVQIPTGIGILIPEDYFIDIRSKSGNFSNEYTSVTGLIDENYTYGFSVQLVPYNTCTLEANEKFAQIVLIKANKIYRMEEITLDKWENLSGVKARRKNRTGGFGSTGKHK